jgi:cobalamin biosynthesis Co2+ chelatase CbiK
MLIDHFIDSSLYEIDTAILGEKVLVKRLREGDGKVFHDLVAENSSLISEYFPVLIQALSTIEGAEFFVRQKIIQWLNQESFSFGIWDKEKMYLVAGSKFGTCI